MEKGFKDSKISWVGSIPERWCVQRNKNAFICSKELIGELSSSTQLLSLTTKGIRAIKEGDTSGKVPESYNTYQIVKNNNLVMCLFDLDCSAVFAGLSNYEGMISPAYKVLSCKKSIIPQYANYWFAYVFDGRKFMHYSKNIRYSLTYDEFSALKIVIPPLFEQQHIVEYLDEKCGEIDMLIELQEQMIEKLKIYKQSVISEAVTKGLNPDVLVKRSGIDWIKKLPVHWNVITPKALFSLRKEKAKKGERQLTASQQYGIIYQDEYMQLTGTKIVTVMKDFDILKHVESGDFVISMRSFQGGLEYSENTGSISSAYVMLIPNPKYVYPKFYRWLFKSSFYINALQSTSNMVRDGQAMRYSNFAQVPLYVVPLSEQKEIASYLDEKCADIDRLIDLKQQKIEMLKDYKKSLIYEAVTGKLNLHY